ncbi:hypothetical protein NC652_004593 [Populus alba x Populus x berolinensis]|nr:hypothetical protein NC652_004593 [Populus alba x Populus x berolinensis]
MISLALEFEKHAKQTRLVTFYMINSILGDFTEIHVFELLWCCEYDFDWWEVIPNVSLAMGYKLASHCNSYLFLYVRALNLWTKITIQKDHNILSNC